MIDALFSQPNYVAAKRMLDVTVLRQEAIASNIANVETPNYKRIDVAPAFTAELQRALSARDTHRLASLQPHLQTDPTASAPNRDGNTVQFENELLQLSQNTLAHTLESQLLSGTLLKLRLAITGRAA